MNENNGVVNNGVRLESDRLLLREVMREDIASIARLANNIKVSQYMQLLPFPYKLSDAEWWVNHYLEKRAKNDQEAFDFAIVLKDSNSFAGVIGLNKIDRSQGLGGIGYWLGEEFWRKGIMSEAAKLVLRFAFEVQNLRRIDISAAVENGASNALIRKLGFEYEGMRRKNMISKASGVAHDLNIYGLLREDWEKKNKK